MSERVLRPSAQRRRDALISATLEVIAEGGYSSVSNRTVTEKAKLPLSTVGYFFPSILALTEEAFLSFTREHIVKHEDLAELLATYEAPPNQIISAFAASALADRTYTLAAIETYLWAARNEEAREGVERQMGASHAVAAAAARLAGAPDPDGFAPGLFSLLLGAALQRAAVPGSIDENLLSRIFRTMLIGALYDSGDEVGARRLRDEG